MDALVNTLGKDDRELLRQTEDAQLAALDEDELVTLHKRIRKARNKYVGVYRRSGSKKVRKKGARGLAKQANTRNAARAEAFEDALSRVSSRLGQVAADAAAQLRAERLAAAKSPGTWPGSEAADNPDTATESQVVDRKPKGTGSTKRTASSRAAGARRQAKKDAR